MKWRVHIKADTDDELKEELRECSFILIGLRESTKAWEGEYGSKTKDDKEKWEKRADDFIKKHKVYYK